MKDLHAILGLKADPAPSGADDHVAVPADAHEPAKPTTPRPFNIPRRTGYAILFMLTACATASTPGREPPPLAPILSAEERALAFTLEAPGDEAMGPDLRLWATHYHTPVLRPAAETLSATFPLVGRNGEAISPPLAHRDWCEAAL
jgi:hypothetical protein